MIGWGVSGKNYAWRWVMTQEFECDGSSGDCERRGEQIERLRGLLRDAILLVDPLSGYDEVVPDCAVWASERAASRTDWLQRAKEEVG
jgi:hypothetical protein